MLSRGNDALLSNDGTVSGIKFFKKNYKTILPSIEKLWMFNLKCK